jgi:hypothetical protein
MFRHPVFFAILGVALGELLLPGWLRTTLAPAGDLRVNPYPRRGWDDYIRAACAPRGPEVRVLVLSNSQGHGPELPPDDVYTTRLQAELNEGRAGRPVRVVNWCFGPNRVPEAMVLLARAHDLAPDVVLAVFPPLWFQEEDYVYEGQPTPLSLFPSDVTDTAWFYRSRLPETFRAHYLGPRQIVRAYLARYLPSYALRDLPISYLRKCFGWLSPLIPEGARAAWFSRGEGRLSTLRHRPVWDGTMRPPHPQLLRMFNETAEALRSHRIFVFAPHCFETPLEGRSAVYLLQEELLRNGWEVWDMMQTVPWNEFLEGQNIHLSAKGHAVFAHALAERLRPELAELGPRS